MQDSRALVQRWFDEVWNQGRESTMDELMAEDASVYGLGEAEASARGAAGFKAFFHTMREMFPDIHFRIEESIVEGDKVAVRVTIEGTHKGGGFGVPATGRRVRFTGNLIIHLKGGKLVAGWNSWDQLGFLRQIGALPAASSPDALL